MMIISKMAMKTNILMETERRIGELYIYDEVKPDEVGANGNLIKSSTSAATIQKELESMGDITELNVYISSYGGSVKEGLSIYSQLQRIRCKKTAYIDGIAASIASVIAMACDEIVMYTTSLLMIHNASMLVYGNSDDMRKAADDLDVISGAAKRAYITKSGGKLSEETVQAMMSAEKWLTPNECLEIGLCDRIGNNKDTERTDNQRSDESGERQEDTTEPKEESPTRVQMSAVERINMVGRLLAI